MNGRIAVSELLRALKDTYHSIDVRTVALKEGDHWTSALTIVRIIPDDPDAAAKCQKELQYAHGRVETEDIRIVLDALPFSEWPRFVENCVEGVVRTGGDVFQLQQKFNLDGQQGSIQRYPREVRQDGSRSWPTFEVWSGQHHPQKLSADALVRQVNVLGWSSIYEAVNVLCGINVATGLPYNYDFYLTAPIFALILDMAVSTTKGTLMVSMARHRDLPQHNVLAVAKEWTEGRWQIRKRLPLVLETAEILEGPFERASAAVELPSLRSQDSVEVKVVHPAIGELYSVQETIGALVPEAERNALWEALKYFCSEPNLTEMLVRPYEHKSKRLKESAAFELHVAWLLGLCGLSTVVLGEYEQLLAANTNVQRGSADILAAVQQEKLLLVVACTLGPPKGEDFTNIVHVCEILRREVFDGTTVRVQPVVFTGAAGYGYSKPVEGGIGEVPVLDADGIARLLELVQAGHERRFFQFLNSAGLGLRDAQ